MRGRLPPVRWHVMYVCLTCFFRVCWCVWDFIKGWLSPLFVCFLGITIKLFNLRNGVWLWEVNWFVLVFTKGMFCGGKRNGLFVSC